MKASKSVRYLCQAVFALGSILPAGIPAYGQGVPGGNNTEEIARWSLIMGPTFNAMHHYCWGLMNTNRALLLVRDQRWRAYHLNYSISEFDYVIRGAPRNFRLLPEILTKKGENLIRLDRGQDGIVELQRAIELKPDYWPPYAAISDYYKNIGELAQAREWLEEGLSASPNTKALMRRLAELNSPQIQRKTEPPAER